MRKDIPVVVLLHAFPLSGTMWEPQAKALNKTARVVMPELSGRTVREMAANVANFLDRLYIKEAVIVIGLSMGGYVALEFVRNYPKRVRAMGFFATKAGADSAEGRKKRYETVRMVKQKGTKPLIKAMVSKLLGKTSQSKRPEVVKLAKKIMTGVGKPRVIQALMAMAKRRDNTSYLKKIKAPTLILAGKEDVVIPIEDMRLFKRIPSSRFHVIPKAGHLLNLEQPKKVNALLKKFVESLA